MREKRAELTANLDHVHQTLQDGARRAREVAGKVVARAKLASGLN